MASVRQQKEIKKHIEEIRTLTKKVMPIVLVLETEEELKLLRIKILIQILFVWE